MSDPYEMKPLYDDVTRIETQDQAETWLRHLLGKLIEARDKCNVRIPGDPQATVQYQKSAERQYLVHYGSMVGALRALHAVKKVTDSSYESFRQAAARTLAPTIVGAF